MPPYDTIRYQQEDGVGTLTLARPHKRNAQNPRMWEELRDLGARVQAQTPLRCLLVTGEGPAFSAGIDLVEGLNGLTTAIGRHSSDDAVALGLQAANSFSWIAELDCATLAVVHGYAYGAGLQLALACDFRVFTESAQVGLSEIRFGILPDMGATWRLPRIVGDARAKELVLLGRTIGAAEALQIGLANQVVPDDERSTSASEWTARLKQLPPLAVAGAKRAIQASWTLDPRAAGREAVVAQLTCIRSSDFQEALTARAEGRSPNWLGR